MPLSDKDIAQPEAELKAQLKAAKRDLEIEASVERVRSRALAMQRSDDLMDVADLMRTEMSGLGASGVKACTIYTRRADGGHRVTEMAQFGEETGELSFDWDFDPADLHPDVHVHRLLAAEEFVVLHLDRAQIELLIDESRQYDDEYVESLEDTIQEHDISDLWIAVCPAQSHRLAIDFDHEPDAGECRIVRRMATAFDVAYQRFKDLERAEAQIRAAQIQAALERIRRVTAGMQDPSDLIEVVKQIKIEMDTLYPKGVVEVSLMQEADEDTYQFWTIQSVEEVPDSLSQFGLRYPKKPDPPHPMLDGIWNVDEPYKVVFHDMDDMWQIHESLAHYVPHEADMLRAALESGNMQGGWLAVSSIFVGRMYLGWFMEPPEELASVQPRFAELLSEAQQRAEELQRAQQMARKAQIEASLERIRRASSDMSKPSDLTQVVKQIKQELDGLYGGDVWEITLMMEADEENFRFWSIQDAKEIPDTLEQFGVLFPKVSDPPHPMVDRWWNLEGTYTEFRNTLEEAWQVHASLAVYLPEEAELVKAVLDSGGEAESWHTVTAINEGRMFLIWGAKPPEEMSSVQPRFAAVLSEAQRRAQELQLAKEMAREAQIEAALERVRGRALAMRTSEELTDVVTELRRQMGILGQEDLEVAIIHLYDVDEEDFESWGAMRNPEGDELIIGSARMPKKGVPVLEECISLYESSTSDYTVINEGQRAAEFMSMLAERAPAQHNAILKLAGDQFDKMRAYWSFSDFQGGSMGIVTYQPPDADSTDLLGRTAKVFDLAYRRFKDLRDSEAAQREAQIEAALERVRAQAIGMRDSDELLEVVTTIHQQFSGLGFDCGAMWYGRYHEDRYEKALTTLDGSKVKTMMILPRPFPSRPEWPKWEKSKQPLGVFKYDAEAGEKIFEDLIALGQFLEIDPDGITPDDVKRNGGITFVQARTTHGEIGYTLWGESEPSEEAKVVLPRFAKVFDLAYRRFKDLKESEEAALEARIDAALERLRSRTLAMQSSGELLDVSSVMTQLLVDLDIDIHWAYVYLYNEEKDELETYLTKSTLHPVEQANGKSGLWKYPRAFHDPGQGQAEFVEGWKKRDEFRKVEFPPAEFETWADQFQMMFDDLGYTRDDYRPFVPDGIFNVEALMGPGYVGMGGARALTEAETDILVRFAKEFEGTYRRFLDILKAEASARESRVETALERVRSQAMAMQKPEDISGVSLRMFKELETLGIESLRSGIAIPGEGEKYVFRSAIKNEEGDIELVLGGGSIDVHPYIRKAYDTWREEQDYQVTVLEDEGLTGYYKAVFDSLPEPDQKARMQAVQSEKEWFATFSFKDGWLYTFKREAYGDEELELYQRFARVFGLAYQRYHDLTKAEEDYAALLEEKARTEKALSDLQATQKQLVEQEKLASLGSLTAGIAHEIKNPLNFVNNFAEVSTELMEELAEAVAKGDTEEAAMILDDLQDNAIQIAKHGKRADSIVRSMMQHARGGASEQETIVVNDFLEEYANLAWHGMRARDHGFQAEVKRDFDLEAGELQVMPQELGRVVLNLLNNAFDAIKNQDDGVVTVASRRSDEGVTIMVSDNGPGIPDDIRQKIFEPFFTTKATGEGTGLGLSLSYDIIAKGHGGQMTVEESPEGGALFTISLPAQK